VNISVDQQHRAGEEPSCDPIPFERRQSDRWGMEGVATAFELAGENFGRMHTLKMLNYSHLGMGSLSETAIPPGTVVSIGFQAPGYLAKRGSVLRCVPRGEGYNVAVLFEQRLAA